MINVKSHTRGGKLVPAHQRRPRKNIQGRTLSLRLSEETFDRTRELAERNRMTMSEFVRTLLERL